MLSTAEEREKLLVPMGVLLVFAFLLAMHRTPPRATPPTSQESQAGDHILESSQPAGEHLQRYFHSMGYSTASHVLQR